MGKMKVSEVGYIIKKHYQDRPIGKYNSIGLAEYSYSHPFYDCEVLLNQPPGLGDFLILTPFVNDCIVYTSFPDSKLFLEHFSTCDVDSYYKFDFGTLTTPKEWDHTFGEIRYVSEVEKYDWGGGHAIQRISKALGREPQIKPKPIILGDLNDNTINGRVAVKLFKDDGGDDSVVNMLGYEEIVIINEFIDRNRGNFEFISLDYYTENKDLVGLIHAISTCEYFLGIHTGIMHIATGLGLKSIIIAINPSIDNFYFPNIKQTPDINNMWIYPQNVHIHVDGSNPLVPSLKDPYVLERAFDGDIYPYFDDSYLVIV